MKSKSFIKNLKKSICISTIFTPHSKNNTMLKRDLKHIYKIGVFLIHNRAYIESQLKYLRTLSLSNLIESLEALFIIFHCKIS